VHEFHASPAGNARREYQYIAQMADLVSHEGLRGKYTFYVAGLLAERHAEVLQEHGDWDFGGHTYNDTAYADAPEPDRERSSPSPELPELTAGRDAQRADVAKTIAALREAAPEFPAWQRNWRTHYYSSGAVTREVLADQGVRWLSDMGTYWAGEWQPERFGATLVSYVSYPQQARGTSGQPLPLWEMGETTPSDYAVWVSGQRHPHLPWATVLSGAQAARLWCDRLDRALRSEELCVINWHPFHSLQEPERIKALTTVMGCARRQPGLTVLTMFEAGTWWDQRAQVRMVMTSRSSSALQLTLHNESDGAIEEIMVRLFGPAGTQVRDVRTSPPVEVTELPLPDPPAGALPSGLCLCLPPGSQTQLLVRFHQPTEE
jgi:hypothetical protein